MSNRHQQGGRIPERWLDCPKNSVSVIDNKFYAFKTPLDDIFNVRPESCFNPGSMLKYANDEGCPIKLWIDLTNTSRYYANKSIEKEECHYVKIPCGGHDGPPSPVDVKKFISTCSTFVAENPNGYIGVHCLHGFNRTGFMIVSYLKLERKYSLNNAISEFAKSRPPGIYKSDYILELYKRHGDGGDLPPTPPLPDWHTPSDDAEADGETNDNIFKKVTESEATRVRKEIKRLSGLLHQKDRFPGCQPVSMDRDNINKMKKDDYMVSEKADGKRFLMYVAGEHQVFFIDRNNKVFQMENLRFPSAQSKHLVDTLVDGELVTYKVDNKQHYLIYDLISLNGDKVRLKNFDIRYERIQSQIIQPRSSIVLSEEPIGIKRKEFRPVGIANITELLSDKFRDDCPYELDGLIFQPIKYWYRTCTCDNILKWKSADQNSIDYFLKIKEPASGILVGELFVGRGDDPFATIEVTKDIATLHGKIIECKYDKDSGRWVFMRQRKDKPFPNGFKTAQAVWKSIEYPVDEDYLKAFFAGPKKETSEGAGRDTQSRKGEPATNNHKGQKKVRPEVGTSVKTDRHHPPSRHVDSSAYPKGGTSKNSQNSAKPKPHFQKGKSDQHKANNTNVAGDKKLGKTPMAVPETRKADNTTVASLKKPTPKPAPESPKADYSNVEGVKELMKTPKAAVVASVMVSPRKNCTEVKGIKKLPETTKAVPKSPEAGYLNVTGDERLLRTPASTPKADYTNVEGVKRLLQTPKATPMPEELKVEEPQILKEEKEKDRPISPDSGCQTPLEEVVQALEDTSAQPKETEESSSPAEEDIALVTTATQTPTVIPSELEADPQQSEPNEKEVEGDVIQPAITPSHRSGKAAESTPAPKPAEVSESSSGEEKPVEPPVEMVSPARRGSRKPRQDTPAPSKAEATSGGSSEDEVAEEREEPSVNEETPAESETKEEAVPEEAIEEKEEEPPTLHGCESATPVPEPEVTEKEEVLVQVKEENPAVVVHGGRQAPAKEKPVPVVEVADKESNDSEPEEEVKLATKSAPTGRRNRKAAEVEQESENEEKDAPEPVKSPPIRRGKAASTSKANTPVKPVSRGSKRTKSREEQEEVAEENQPTKPTAKKAKMEEIEQPVVRLTRCRVPAAAKVSLDSTAATASPAKPTRSGRKPAGKKVSAEPEQPASAIASPSSPLKPSRGAKKPTAASRKVSVELKQTASASLEPPVETTRTNKKTAPVSKKEQLAHEPEQQASPAPAKTTRNTRKKATPEEVEEPKPAPPSRRSRSTKAAQKVEEEELEVKKPAGRGGRKAPAKAVVEEEEEEVVVARPAAKSKRAVPERVEPEEKRRRVTTKSALLDDVGMMHEDKGHAADIHHHVTDRNLEEARPSPPTEQPATKRSRATRVKALE